MTLLNWALILLLAPQVSAPGNGLPQVLSPEYKTPPTSVKAGQKAEITLRFKLVKGFAITTMPPMTLKLQPPAGVKLEKSEFTTPDKDPKSKDEYYVDLPEIKIPATASAAGTYTIPGQLTYFFCSKDEGFCSKQTLDVKVPFKAE